MTAKASDSSQNLSENILKSSWRVRQHWLDHENRVLTVMFQNLHFFLLKRVFSLYFFFLPSLTAAWKTHKNNTSLSCYHSKQGLSLRVCMFYVLLLPLFCKINDHKAPEMTQLRQTISLTVTFSMQWRNHALHGKQVEFKTFLDLDFSLRTLEQKFRRTQIRWNTRELWILRRRRPYEDEIFSILSRTEVTN